MSLAGEVIEMDDDDATPLVVHHSFSFKASVRRSIDDEELDASLDIGSAGELSADAIRRAYDLSFGTSPLTTPSTSNAPSRSATPCPSLSMPKQDLPTPASHLLASKTLPTSSASSLPLKRQRPSECVPPLASDARLPGGTKSKKRPRKRKRTSRSSVDPSQAAQQQPAARPSSSTAGQHRAHVEAWAPPPPCAMPTSLSQPLLTSAPPKEGPTQGQDSLTPRRDQAKGHARRRLSRQDARAKDPSVGRTPRLATVLKHIAPAETMKTKMNISDIPSASTGFMALPDKKGRVYTLRELLDVRKFKLVKWDGRTSRAIVDSNDLVIAVLAGKPGGTSWNSACESAFKAAQESTQRCSFAQDDKDHRRGKFSVLNAGISFGGGQMLPGNLYHSRRNAEELTKLLNHKSFIRIAGFQSGVFAAWAPKLHSYYKEHFNALLDHHPKLRRNFENSEWAACAFNFGPRTVTTKHRDFANLPFGLCGITALGCFDPTKGGHIVIWELKLVIEFPPGSTILLPSAVVAHSNTAISAGETRSSFTQFSAGGLFRWTEHGFQLEPDFEATLSPSQAEAVLLENEERCKLGLSLFSTHAELQNL